MELNVLHLINLLIHMHPNWHLCLDKRYAKKNVCIAKTIMVLIALDINLFEDFSWSDLNKRDILNNLF